MSQGKSAPEDEVLEVLKFTYQEDGDVRDYPVRIAMFDGNAWFIARDVARVIGKPMMVVVQGGVPGHDQILVESTSLSTTGPELPLSSGGGVWLISEQRFYQVASMAAKCWGFKRWVTHEVLPTIRHLNPRSNRRIDLPVAQETVPIMELVKSDGSDPDDPDRPIKKRRKPRPRKKPCGLYRFFDVNNRLLYVGITWSVGARVKQHKAQQLWWKRVHHMTVETYPSREAAVAAELEAIRTEHPRYNVQGVPSRRRKVV